MGAPQHPGRSTGGPPPSDQQPSPRTAAAASMLRRGPFTSTVVKTVGPGAELRSEGGQHAGEPGCAGVVLELDLQRVRRRAGREPPLLPVVPPAFTVLGILPGTTVGSLPGALDCRCHDNHFPGTEGRTASHDISRAESPDPATMLTHPGSSRYGTETANTCTG